MSRLKNAALKKQDNNNQLAKTKKGDNTPAHYDNPWLEAAAEAGGNGFGRLLKFVKGKWEIGDDELPSGTEFIAHLDQLARGWVKFEDGEITDLRIVKIADGGRLPEREALPDLDPKNWKETDNDGRPRDPYVKQWYLPLVSVDIGDLCTFVTSSAGGNSAIANLCRVFGNRQDGLLPIIALKVRSYKHRQYGRIETPDFAIVGWHGSGPTPMTAAKPVNQIPPKTGNAAVNLDMNDEIPL